jgi:anaerobic C4-dicarboxylate transporter
MFPACTLHFFLPVNTAQLTAIALDTTRTTRVGRYVLDHSFMRPGLVTLAVTLSASMVLASWTL